VEEPGFSPRGTRERDAREFAAEVGGVALAGSRNDKVVFVRFRPRLKSCPCRVSIVFS
jgi:hypothetical protein